MAQLVSVQTVVVPGESSVIFGNIRLPFPRRWVASMPERAPELDPFNRLWRLYIVLKKLDLCEILK